MKTRTYEDFSQSIHASARVKGFPLRAMFELTYRCNFKCRHCYVPHSWRNDKELKTRDVFQVLDQLRDAGCFYLGFTGGEVLMRRDAMTIFRQARKFGFEVIIYSNGSLITGEIARQLGDLGLNKVDITIPAMSQPAFERITEMPGSHARVFRAIEVLQKNAVPLGFKTCVLRDNEKEIGQIEAFAKSLGALHRLDASLSPRLDGSKEPYMYRGTLSETKHSKSRQRMRTREEACFSSASQKASVVDLFPCGAGLSQVAITPRGELKMCLMIARPTYSILGSSLPVAWRRLKAFARSIKPDEKYKCDQCDLNMHCKWCPAQGRLHGKGWTSCSPEIRAKALKAKGK